MNTASPPLQPQGFNTAAAVAAFLSLASQRGIHFALQQLERSLAGLPCPAWIECGQMLLERQAAAAAVLLLDDAMRSWPQQVELRYWCGNARRVNGDFGAAEALFRSVLKQQPGHEQAAISLAMMLRDAGRCRAAAEVLIESWRCRPGSADSSWRCARFLQECSKPEQASAVCEEALARGELNADLLSMAGRLALNLGHFDLARGHLLRSITEIEHRDPACLLLLANAQRYRQADHPDLALFEALRADASLSDEIHSLACFAAGKALDDLGDFAGAAMALRQANRLGHQYSAWSTESWREFVQTQLNLDLPRLPGFTTSSGAPVFIIGLPRTGTTLAASLLGRHPEVRNRGELNWLFYVHQQLEGRPADTQILSAAAAVYRKFLVLDDPPRRWHIDKNPLNLRYLPLIDALFPDARIILCRRSIRDTALSIWSQSFAHVDNDYSFRFEDIAEFAAGCERILLHWLPRLRVPVYTLEYEYLASQPAHAVEHLRNFLDLPEYDPFDPAASTGTVATASVWQVRQPVYQRSIERWRAYAPHLPELLAAFPEANS